MSKTGLFCIMQGHIWRTGFQNQELKGEVFEDVPVALEKWNALGIKVTFILLSVPLTFFILFFCCSVLSFDSVLVLDENIS